MPTFLAEEQKFVPWIAEMKKNIPGMNFSLRTESTYMYLIPLLLIYTQKVTQAVSMELKILLQQYCDEIYGNDI